MKLSFLAEALVSSLEHIKKPSTSGEKIAVSRTVSAVAFLYEKIRVAMEYREDHLVRRAAIVRILRRRLFLNESGRGIAEYLLKELLWAKYLPPNSVPVSKIDDAQETIDKYMMLRNEIVRGRPFNEQEKLNDWLLEITACEVEEKISPNKEREAFVNFIFNYFKDSIVLKNEKDLASKIQVYIAVHRNFAKSDDNLIRFEILKLTYPDLARRDWSSIQNQTAQFYQHLKNIDEHLKHKIGRKLNKILSKEIPPFMILRDLFEKNPEKFRTILEDGKNLENEIDSICRKRYEEIGKKLARAATRSIIYIFLTKMLFAFALEYPFDKYVLKKVDHIPLAINTLFPPALMFLVLLGMSAPGQDNTKKIISIVKEIVYLDDNEQSPMTVSLKTPERRPLLIFAFSIIYLLTFMLSFGLVVYALNILDFSIASQIVFLFFLCIVLFFAYRIRKTGREYVVADHESIFTPIADFFLLPILNVGKWLSQEIAKLNVLIAIFDFIIEAPFKLIVEIFEEWFSFVRRKKDEII